MYTSRNFRVVHNTNRGKAEARIEALGRQDAKVREVVNNLRYTRATGRLNADADIHLRDCSGYELTKIVCDLLNEQVAGNEIGRYLNKRYGVIVQRTLW